MNSSRRYRRILFLAFWLAASGGAGSMGAGCSSAAEPVSFRSDVAPVLLARCLACHGPQKAEGGYRVDTYERLMAEGDSFAPGFSPKDLEWSEAFRRITSDDAGERMPLDADPLPHEEIALIQRWIEEGAEFDGPDPEADLASIVPPPAHPDPPKAYPQTLPITALVFSGDGKQLIVGGYHELTVWSAQDGRLERRIKNVGQRTYGLALAPGGKLVAAAGGEPGRLGEVRLFDVASGELVRVFGSTSDVALDLAFDPQGEVLAAASADGAIRLFDVAAGDERLAISSHSDWVTAVAWSQDGARLASASRDKTAKVFDAETGDVVITYSGHGAPVYGAAFHPDGQEVYSGGADNKIHRWRIADGKKIAEIGFGDEVNKLSASGEYLFAASADRTVRQFNAKSRQQIRIYTGHEDWVLAAALDGQGRRLATGGFDGEVRIWNIDDGKLESKFLAAPGRQAPEKEQ